MKIVSLLILAALLSFMIAGSNSIAEGENMSTSTDHGLEVATFAGGCFWCVEADYEKLEGIKEVISGYAGGQVENPSYEQVSSGSSGHIESVQVHYDPEIIGYADLVEYLWRHTDPTDGGGQFVDRGGQYRTAIFYHDEEQKRVAEQLRDELDRSGRFDKPVATEILPLKKFWPAEAYHQDYYRKNPLRYRYYRYNSGRDDFLEEAWGKEKDKVPAQRKGAKRYPRPSDAELRDTLTPMQYEVTQEEGTERPFHNEYWNEKREGIYVDIVSGEPLFSSKDKFESGTGWPSFARPLVADNIVEETDFKLLLPRTEVRSRHGDSHLGHVFDDGPQPTGLRYCINSAALRFIPKDKLAEEGYEEFISLFD